MRTPEYTDSHDNIVPVEADTTLNSGGAVCLNAAGNAVEGGDTAGLRMAGTAVTDVDNSAGDAGDQSIAVRRGQSEFLNSEGDPVAQADAEKMVYLEDAKTICKTGGTNRIAAGVLRRFNEKGNPVVDTRYTPDVI